MSKLLSTLLLCMLAGSCLAQMRSGGQPLRLRPATKSLFAEAVPVVQLPALNKRAINAWERTYPGNNRLATPVAVDLSADTHGQWTELADGGRVWHAQLQGKGALAISLLMEQVYFPAGSHLYVYTPDGAHVAGGYGFHNNQPSQRLMTHFVPGDEVVVEYYEPAAVRGQGRFHIFRMDYAYRYDQEGIIPLGEKSPLGLGYGMSLNCQVNVACPQGAEWQDESRGVCRIVVVLEEGTGYCSGTLVNNTARDATPYVLSGWHCQGTFTPLFDMWRFDFGYVSQGCVNDPVEPGFQSIQGAQVRSAMFDTDGLLLELSQPVPASFNPYYNGWNRTNTPFTGGTLLHHPSNDVMKISRENHQLAIFPQAIDWDNGTTTPGFTHFRVFMDEGAVEPGSSGGAFFSTDQHLLVGQLHGGVPDCNPSTTYVGRLHRSWDGGGQPSNRLKDWLDPLGLAPDTLHGMNHPEQDSAVFRLEGVVMDFRSQPVDEVSLLVQDAIGSYSSTTDTDGNFALDGLYRQQVYTVQASKSEQAKNNLSVFDMIVITKHILGVQRFDNPYAYIAADVNGSGTVSTLDVIKIRKVILGLEQAFAVPVWQFIPADYIFSQPTNPLGEVPQGPFALPAVTGGILPYDLIAIKAGNVTGD